MVHVGVSDSSWLTGWKEERQSRRITTKDQTRLHLSTLLSWGFCHCSEKGAEHLLGKPEGWCFLQKTSKEPVAFQAEPEVQEPAFMPRGFEFLKFFLQWARAWFL